MSQATAGSDVQNGVGRVGALIADLLFNFFGRPAYLFTVMVFYLGWMLYREQKTQQALTRMDFALRFGGFLATLVTSCALSTLHFSPVGFNETAGGAPGPASLFYYSEGYEFSAAGLPASGRCSEDSSGRRACKSARRP